ncbi:zinc ion transmembrane transport [Nesidiocoris tenuis]|uniref:Zinc ion transmembrane transport n=1 Tax=Nesidiocoris tenuis TaxID=355587 RepID=A0ABN7AJN8_9HEMI|nr:zinc ion transmembrane transport [Nesidiocoris tenuis]
MDYTGEKTPLTFLSHDPLKYGSLSAMANVQPGTSKVIVCIHGKPTGCCATVIDGDGKFHSQDISIEEHCHQDRSDESLRNFKKARRKLIFASILCVFFMVAEVVGGVLSSSLAVATDAAHLLTDFAGFMISLFALYLGQRKPSRAMPFGWHRAEVIGALTSVLTIWLVTGILVYMAIERIIYGEYEIDAIIMLITSGLGVLVNLVMGMSLHQHSHSHGHNNNDELATKDSDVKKNINVRAAFIHVIGDLIQSVGVFIAALVIQFKPEWKIVDPICTFLFSVLVLITTFGIIKDTLIVLMEGLPRDVDFDDVMNTLLSIDGVMAVHNLRIWALSLDKTALAAHIAIKPGTVPQAVLKSASNKIYQKYNFFEMTLQIENFTVKMEDCAQCQVPH